MAASGRLDLSGIIHHFFKLFKAKLQNSASGPCDGPILKMHYRWAFFFSLGGFMTVFYGWYYGQIIHCINTFKGDQNARADYTQICLSYPFILDDNKNKRFLLFYRWIHWTFLLLAFLFYFPRKLAKSIETLKSQKILQHLQEMSPRYDGSEKDMVARSLNYMVMNLRTHNDIYIKYICLNVLTLFIDIFVVKFLDFVFHDRFIMLIPSSYPFHRDPINFKDYISLTFPPFASCILNENHEILGGRVDTLGCHLTHMELYEKLFFVFWFLIMFLIVVNSVYVIYLLAMMLPQLRNKYISVSKPWNAPNKVNSIHFNLCKYLRVGDVYMLTKIKSHMHHSRFYNLLLALDNHLMMVEKNNYNSAAVQAANENSKFANTEIPDRNQVRHRNSENLPYNPAMPDTDFNTHSGKGSSLYSLMRNKVAPQKLNNTSILIE